MLCIESEEEVVVEEEVVPQAENPPVENNSYFDICGTDPEPPATQGKPAGDYGKGDCRRFATVHDAGAVF